MNIRSVISGIPILLSFSVMALSMTNQSLVTNGSFETPDPSNPSKPLGWHQGNENCTWVDGGHNGGKCVCLKPGSYVDYFYGWFSLIDVKPHTKYKVTCWVKTENVDSAPKLIFNKSFDKWDINLPKSSDWTEFKTIIDSGTAQGWSWCPIKKFRGKPYVAFTYFGKTGAVYYDDLSIVEYGKSRTQETSTAAKLIPGKDYIWLEAENGESNLYPVSNPASSGGQHQHIFGRESIPPGDKYYYVNLPFSVEKGGHYKIYISTSLPSSRWRSAYEACLDGKLIKAGQVASVVGKPYQDKIGWVYFGKRGLSSGKHTLTVRTNKRSTRYNKFCLDVDAAVLVPVSNNWRPTGTAKPTFVAKPKRIPYPWKPGMEDIKICEDVNEYLVTGSGGSTADAAISQDNPQPNGKPSLLVKADFSRRAPIVIQVKKAVQIKSPGGRIVLWIDDNTERPLDYSYYDSFRLGIVFTDAKGKEIEVYFMQNASLFLHKSSGEINPAWMRLEVPICMAEEEGKVEYPLSFHEMRVYSYFWTDPAKGHHNEFFLGDLSVEMKGIYFRYFAYDRAEISPDLVSTPLFFGFDCNFGQNTDYPQNVEVILELPESVKLEKQKIQTLRAGDITKLCQMQTQPITRDSKKFIRYTIQYPITANCLFTYKFPGYKRIRYYLSTKLKKGTVDAYYYARLPEHDYTEAPRKLPLDVIKIKEGIAPKRLMTQMRGDPSWPGMIESLNRLGINHVNLGQYTDSDFILRCKEAGIAVETDLAGGYIIGGLAASDAPGAVDTKGKVSQRTPCLSRPEAGIASLVEKNKYLIDKGFTFFSFDDEYWGDIQCFCDKCLAGFEKFRKIHGKGLPGWEPWVFCELYHESNRGHLNNLQWWADTSSDDSAKKLFRLWQDYHHANYSKAAGLLKKGMQEYAASKGIREKIVFYDEWLQCTCSKYSARIAAEEAFDYISSDYYGANPKEGGDKAQIVGEWVKGSGAKLYWLLGPGLCYWRIQNNFQPHTIMKWNVLETFAVGVDGVNMYDYADIDLLEMKYYSEAIWTVLPVEDIVIEGKRAEKDVQLIKGEANLRALKKGNEYLILVSEYDHTDSRQVEVKVPDALKGLPVWNLNERKQVGKISRRNNSFQAKLTSEERAVMYYVGEKRIGK